jgi:predicted nucleic-acid-binding Zn-ribbon protein
MYEVTCLTCGIRELYGKEDEAKTHAYNHERLLTHSTSSGYFVSVNEV